VTFAPISLTAAVSSASRRPVMNTYAPSSTNCFAAASPNPAAAARHERDLALELCHVSPSPSLFRRTAHDLEKRPSRIGGDCVSISTGTGAPARHASASRVLLARSDARAEPEIQV